ncbi:MAG: hypothetical protein WAM81_07125 [Acidimicrobiia bacterium]
MGRLIYRLNVSLDGFVETPEHVDHNAGLVRGDVEKVLAELLREFPGDLDVGGPFWLQLDTPMRLRLVETHTFSSGAVLTSFALA